MPIDEERYLAIVLFPTAAEASTKMTSVDSASIAVISNFGATNGDGFSAITRRVFPPMERELDAAEQSKARREGIQACRISCTPTGRHITFDT